MMDEERTIKDYSLIELQEYIDNVYDKRDCSKDRAERKILKRQYKEAILLYNEISRFECYRMEI